MFLWRMANYADLAGHGAMITGGRWHARGQSMVYCSDSPITALLEVIRLTGKGNLPASMQLIKIFSPPDITPVAPVLDADELDNLALTRRIGDDFITLRTSCLMQVPSPVAPDATTILINPRHPDAMLLTVVEKIPWLHALRQLRTQLVAEEFLPSMAR